MKINREEFQELLFEITSCGIQYDGWTCGTCFFAIDNSLTNADWRSLLYFRGDYFNEDELLPKDWIKRINRLDKMLKEKLKRGKE